MKTIQYFSQSWGDSAGAVFWTKNEDIRKEFEIAGCRRNVKNDDYLIGEYNDTILYYLISDVKYKSNPSDMFFATATFINAIKISNINKLRLEECNNDELLFNTLINHKYGNASLCKV